MKGNLTATLYTDILDDSVLPTLWQHCGEGHFLFQRGSAPVPLGLVWKNLTGLHRSLTSTPSNTFGMNVTQNLSVTSVLDLTDALVSEWDQIPAAGSTSGGKSETRRVEAVRAAVSCYAVHRLLAILYCDI